MTMGELSAFIGQNYFWILVIGIVIIMALIGFIADKKSLVIIQRKPKEKQEDKIDNTDLLNNVQEKSLGEVIYGNVANDEKIGVIEETALEQSEDSLVDVPKTINGMEIVDFEDVVSKENDVPSELYAPLATEEDNLVTEVSLTEQPVNEEVPRESVEVADVPSELYAPLGDPKNSLEVVDFESNQPVLEATEQSPIEVDLPDLTAVNEQIESAPEEEDVWKF